MPKNASEAYPNLDPVSAIGFPLLHNYIIGSADGVTTCTIIGYPCGPDGVPPLSAAGAWPASTYDVDVMDTIHNYMLAWNADSEALVNDGPWPTGFKITAIQGASLRVRLGAAQASIGNGKIAFTGIINAGNQTDVLLPAGDYSTNPVFLGVGGPS